MSTQIQFQHYAKQLFLTDGGLETTLIFHEGIDLPYFAAFALLAEEQGCNAIKNYYRRYLDIARQQNTGFILESATWRASSDWGALLGYNETQLKQANLKAIALLKELLQEYSNTISPILISGCIGPRGDGYKVTDAMSVSEAAVYHEAQIVAFREANVDLITAITMTNVKEAIAIASVARSRSVPVVISFTVEADGKLPDGTPLSAAISLVDEMTHNYVSYFMINCAHPSHFSTTIDTDQSWTKRIKGIRANASKMSHAELDEAEHLDDGDPQDLGKLYRDIREQHPHINVLGGCCGTDHRHIQSISETCLEELLAEK
ncbi:MAG: homocysteine S-methyltransferase family protein [Aestuariibacter sp.]